MYRTKSPEFKGFPIGYLHGKFLTQIQKVN